MSYYSRVEYPSLIIEQCWPRRQDTTSYMEMVGCFGDGLEVYYDISKHHSINSNSVDINPSCVIISIRFKSKAEAKAKEGTRFDISDKYQEIRKEIKQFIKKRPASDTTIFLGLFDFNTEISRLKSILDQHKISY
jgi:hypothetical protein